MPTLEEINAVAPDTPVFMLHLYGRALLNRPPLRAVRLYQGHAGFPGGEILRDTNGKPTGLLIAKPNATILYATLAKGPKLPPEHQMNSTRHFMRELNRLGVTSIIDAGGGFQNYPDDYRIIEELHRDGQLTVRIAYNLFTQKPKEEQKDFAPGSSRTGPGKGDDISRKQRRGRNAGLLRGGLRRLPGRTPRPPANMEAELESIIRLLATNSWPLRLHATYDESNHAGAECI